jgi:D-alanine-D-alanine ligase
MSVVPNKQNSTANKAKFGKVAVMLGGTSAESAVSLLSGENVLNCLLAAGVDAQPFDLKERPLSALHAMNIDRVFIAMHGRGGEDGTLQGALEFMGVAYTGSGVLGSALAMDKVRSKQLFKASDLPTPEFKIIRQATYRHGDEVTMLDQLGGVVFVKPAQEGSSIGMSRADTPQQLADAIDVAFGFDEAVLIEAFVDGPEYTVAILADQALPVIELRTPRTFYDYQAKYQSNNTQYLCPCDLNEADTSEIQRLAKLAFDVVGAKVWGRVDVMRDQNGQFQLLEVNTVPGMTAKSLVPMAAKAGGIDAEQLVVTILEQTLEKTAGVAG